MTSRTQENAEVPNEAFRLVDEADRRVCGLTNGMTVIAARHDDAALVAVRVYVRGGSAFEAEYSGSGITHLLEHVVTGDAAGGRSEQQISEQCEAIGGLVNAYTCDDHVCYHATTYRDHWEDAVALLADWVARPALSEAVFERELGVVQRELERDRDEPETQLDELMHEIIYPRNPLRYPIIGHRESLKRLTALDLAAYHTRTHVPDNVTVVVVGDIDVDQAVLAARRAFAGFVRRPVKTEALPQPAGIAAPRRLIKRMEVASASATIAWQTVREGHVDDVPLDMLCAVLTHGSNARIVKKLRWDRGLVFDLSGTHECMWHTIGTFEITVQLEPGRLDAVEHAVIDEIAGLDSRPITQAELDRAVRQCVFPLEKQRQTAEGLATQLGEDFVACGDVNYTEMYIERVKRATAADLMRVARFYLSPEKRATAAILLIDELPTVKQKTTRASQRATERSTLANGMRCLIRPMNTGPFVSVFAAFTGGLQIESSETNGICNLLAEVLPRGTTTRSAEEIAEFFESRGAYLSTGVGAETIALECTVLADDLDETLEVVADVVRSPAFAPDQIAKLKPAICDAIARIDDDWQTELARFSRSVFFQNSPYRLSPIGTVANVERFQPADLCSAHAKCVVANRGVLSLAGPIEALRAHELCERHFGTIEADHSDSVVRFPTEPPVRRDRLFIKTVGPHREVAGLFVGFPAPLLTDRSNRAALAVLDAMLVGYTLSGGRLFADLRGGNRNLVYEVTGRTLLGSWPGLFAIVAACDPSRVNDVVATIRRAVNAVCDGRFDDAELDRAKSVVRAGELDHLQTPGDFARRCAADELTGLGHDDWQTFLEDVQNTSRDAILRYGREFMSHVTIAVVTPKPDAVSLSIEATA